MTSAADQQLCRLLQRCWFEYRARVKPPLCRLSGARVYLFRHIEVGQSEGGDALLVVGVDEIAHLAPRIRTVRQHGLEPLVLSVAEPDGQMFWNLLGLATRRGRVL